MALQQEKHCQHVPGRHRFQTQNRISRARLDSGAPGEPCFSSAFRTPHSVEVLLSEIIADASSGPSLSKPEPRASTILKAVPPPDEFVSSLAPPCPSGIFWAL